MRLPPLAKSQRCNIGMIVYIKESPMNIIVLVKQVPATDFEPEVDDTGCAIVTDQINWVMNPYDELAVEEALRIREALGGRVTLVSAGPETAVDVIRTGLAMGADEGMLVSDPDLPLWDSPGLAKILAAAVTEQPFDLILTGMKTVDDDSYATGPAVAEFLGIPCITQVVHREIENDRIRCHRAVEGGTEVLEAPLPALITTQRGLNEPRFTALSGIMKARKKEIPIRNLADLEPGAAVRSTASEITGLGLPPARKGGRVIEAETPEGLARELVRLLQEDARII
jgi:electron transfer flavoprotein beta subunit